MESKKCKGCGRVITSGDVEMCPELKSGYCNWCRPDQIPLHLRIYSVHRRNDWFRKGSSMGDLAKRGKGRDERT